MNFVFYLNENVFFNLKFELISQEMLIFNACLPILFVAVSNKWLFNQRIFNKEIHKIENARQDFIDHWNNFTINYQAHVIVELQEFQTETIHLQIRQLMPRDYLIWLHPKT
jgi:hypothetical protein